MNVRTAHALAISAAIASTVLVGCGPEEQPYQAKPAVSGKKPNLPAVPTLPQKVKSPPPKPIRRSAKCS